MKTKYEIAGRLSHLRDETAALFEKGGPELKLSDDEAALIRANNDEMTALGKDLDAVVVLERIQASLKAAPHGPTERDQQRPAGPAAPSPSGKTLGERFTDSVEYQTQNKGAQRRFVVQVSDVDVKAVMSEATGYVPANNRGPRVVLSAQRRPVVSDLIPSGTTTDSSTSYMEETTFTNNAAFVAESATKGEAALAYVERNQPIEVNAVTLPITNQQLDDVPRLRALIDNRLTLMLLLSREAGLLTGTGVSPQLQGFLTKAGIQTQAKGADPVPDAVFKAMTKVRYTGFAEPTGYITHPNDWQDIRLLRTVDGIYIWGNPSEAGPERIWGLDVVVTPAITENTGLVGDFAMYSYINIRQGITIEVGWINDQFTKNQQTIRAEERLNLEIYRAASFCTVTGI